MTASRSAALLAGALAFALALPGSAGAAARILPGQSGLKDFDARTGSVAPPASGRLRCADEGGYLR
jgi:hypothetical protein